MDPKPEKHASALAEGEAREMSNETAASATSGDSSNSASSTEAAASEPEKSLTRSSSASRQTVEELEIKALHGKRESKLVRSGTVETQPGAVAVTGPRQVEVAPSRDNGEQDQHGVTTRRHSSMSSLSESSNLSSSESEHAGSSAMTLTSSTPTAAGTDRSTTPPQLEEDDTSCQHRQYEDDVPIVRAEVAEDPPPIMIRAELVPPPTQAYQVEHVQFDEEAPPPTGHFEVEAGQNRPRTENDDDDDDSISKIKTFMSKNSQRILKCHVLFLAVALVFALAMPRIRDNVVEERMLEDDDLMFPSPAAPIEDIEEDFAGLSPTPITKPPTPAPSAQKVYDCYHSTERLVMAQMDEEIENRTFLICPNTKITLGTLETDPMTNHTKIVRGDYPLTALSESIEIRCGSNGRRENACVIEGGFVQVLLQPSLPDPLSHATVNRTDNVVFRGITFTGALDHDGDVGGVSVFANNPGLNVSFIDCAWINMVAPNGLIRIGDSGSAWSLGGPSTDVTFQDSTFADIGFDGPLISVHGQGVSLRQSRFHDLHLRPVLQPCVNFGGGSSDFCHGLLYCLDRSECSLEDICVEDLEYAGPAALAAVSYETSLTVSGSKHLEGITAHPFVPEAALHCSSNLARFLDSNHELVECVADDSSSSNWTNWDNSSCWL